MLVRQLVDKELSTYYTYPIAEPQPREAIPLAPVLERSDRDTAIEIHSRPWQALFSDLNRPTTRQKRFVKFMEKPLGKPL
ncbi:MAG: hypothetical protein AAGC93_26180 [Cyanobacteria bacterium P01_F01_bin.53]